MTKSGQNQTGLDRRGFLLLGARAGLGLGAACALAPSPVLAGVSGFLPNGFSAPDRQLSFLNTHTGEQASVTYWSAGAYVREEMAQIDRVLRDHRTGEVKPIDPALLDLLHSLNTNMETDQPFHVISGYRSPKTNAKLSSATGGVAKKSLHMRGMAIDIRLPGRRLTDLHKAARGLQAGGVGLYRSSDFIHVDVGRVRYW